MNTLLSLLRTRGAWWLGLAGLALSQASWAHPVVQARIGGPLYGPPLVVVAPPPVWLPTPPPVVMAPRVLLPYPVYPAYPLQAYARPWRGERHGHGWGHRVW